MSHHIKKYISRPREATGLKYKHKEKTRSNIATADEIMNLDTFVKTH